MDFRLIAATNRNLAELVDQGQFREDLFYRLNVFPIDVPPLRGRREDIPVLANYFRLRFAEENGVEPPEIPPETLSRMMAYDWPGNVRVLVRPMRRITANMIAFRADPEHPDRIIEHSGRTDEIGMRRGRACRHAARARLMLHQQSRLAALGLAVSKINHDLRNLLASAQLFSDQLSHLPDPKVQRFAPKLMRTLERAIAFCQSTLSYGAAQEPPPERKTVEVEPLIEEVHEALGLAHRRADPLDRLGRARAHRGSDHDQLFRVLVNVARNAVQALEARGARDPARDQIRITGRREGGVVVLEVSDTGPGVPEKARAICSKPSRAPPAPAAPGSGLPSPPSWCARMAAKSRWCRAPSAPPSALPFPIARSTWKRPAARGRRRDWLRFLR